MPTLPTSPTSPTVLPTVLPTWLLLRASPHDVPVQDEVTFVMGQPNFMEQGSCCGEWGLSEGEEGCPQTQSCTACYDRKLGEGYAAYFDEAEFDFTRLVGSYWTNLASSQVSGSRW